MPTGKELLKRKKELEQELREITNPATCTHPDDVVIRNRPLDSGSYGEFYVEYDCPLCGSSKSTVENHYGSLVSEGKWFPNG